MDRAPPFAQRSGVAAAENGQDFRHDGVGDFLRCFGSKVEADGCMEVGAFLRGEDAAGCGEIRDDAFRPFPRSEQADVGEATGEQIAEYGHVVDVVVRHHDRERSGLRSCGQTGRTEDARDERHIGTDAAAKSDTGALPRDFRRY